MTIEWHEIEPGTYEARVGAWLLEVGRSDDATPWCVWVGMMLKDRREGGLFFRDYVTGSLEEAQRAAIAFAAEKCAPFVTIASAEATLAEREACAQWFEDRAANYLRRSELVASNPAAFGGDSIARDVAEHLAEACAQARLDARTIRERTTPATLSTDTLAAIAKARGLCLVDPEYLAKLEASAKDKKTAALTIMEAGDVVAR